MVVIINNCNGNVGVVQNEATKWLFAESGSAKKRTALLTMTRARLCNLRGHIVQL